MRRLQPLVRAFAAVSLTAAAVACSSTTPSFAPATRSTATPVASSQATTKAISAGMPLPFGAASGFSGSIEFGSGSSIPAGAQLVAQTYAGAPASAPRPQARHRAAVTPAPSASPSVLVSEALRYSGIPAIAAPLLAGVPTITTFSGPQFEAGHRYEAELFDLATGSLAGATSGLVSGSSVSFTDALINMTTLDPYLLEVVANSAVPTPAPTASASPTPVPSASAAPSSSPSSPGSAAPTGAATPNPEAKLYVANFYPNAPNEGSITVYDASVSGIVDEMPVATIAGNATSLDQPAGVAVDAAGLIYVVNTRLSSGAPPKVTVYAPNPSGTVNEAPIAVIGGANTGLVFPEGIALDASGKIYIANASNAITVYASHPSGTLDEVPIATISGNSTGLSGPDAVALDANEHIYVANNGSNSVTVYPANPSGTVNEAPIGTLAGSSTGIDEPTGVAVDASGRVYVTSSGSPGSVGIFAAHTFGNVAPIATLTNNQSGYTAAGIALDASGNLFLSNGNSDIRAFAFPPSPSSTEAPFATIEGDATGLVSPLGMAIR